MKILSIFVAFSEKMNFKNSSEIKNSSETMDFGFRMKYGKTQKKDVTLPPAERNYEIYYDTKSIKWEITL